MPMGDSITEGFGVPGGYRQPLYDIITGQGYRVDFVGNQIQASDPTPDRNHWGKSGWGIADTDAITGGRSYVSLQANEGPGGATREGLYKDLDRAISSDYFSSRPGATNILLLLAGTNDIVHQVVEQVGGAVPAGDRGNDGQGEQQDRIAESNFDRLRAFLEKVNERAQASGFSLKVILGTIPDLSNVWNRGRVRDPISDVMRQQVRRYNDLIRNEVASLRLGGIEVKVVDQFSAVGDSLADGIHPDRFGYQQMARTWWGGIEPTLTAPSPRDLYASLLS
jgi:lysophospholipase L1-like esterase